MGEVAADTAPLVKASNAVMVASACCVAEGDVSCTKSQIACTRGQPCGDLPNSRPGELRQPIGLAVAAAEQKDERIDRQRLERALGSPRRNLVGLAAVERQEIGGNRQPPGRRADDVTDIAVAVQILRGRDERRDPHPVRREQFDADSDGRSSQDHRRRLRAVVGNLIARANFDRHASQSLSRDIGMASPVANYFLPQRSCHMNLPRLRPHGGKRNDRDFAALMCKTPQFAPVSGITYCLPVGSFRCAAKWGLRRVSEVEIRKSESAAPISSAKVPYLGDERLPCDGATADCRDRLCRRLYS